VIDEDEKMMLSGDKTGKVVLWNLEKRTPVIAFDELKNSVRALAISNNKRYIAAASNWGELMIWDLSTQKVIHQVNLGVWTEKLSFFEEDRFLLAAAGGTFKTVDLTTGKIVNFVAGHSLQINDFCFSPDGKIVASGSNDKSIKMWQTSEFIPKASKRFDAPEQKNTNQTHTLIAKFIDNNRLAIGTYNSSVAEYRNSLKVLDLRLGKWTDRFEGAMGNISAINISSDGRLLAVGVNYMDFNPETIESINANEVKVWNVDAKDTMLHIFSDHQGKIYDLAFTPDGKHIISSAAKNPVITDISKVADNIDSFYQFPDVKMWALENGKLVQRFKGHKMDIPSLVLNPNAPLLYTASYDKSVKTWNYESGELLHSESAFLHPLAIAKDGKYMLKGAGLHPAGLAITDMESGKTTALVGHRISPVAATFSSSGKYAATGDMSGIVILWNVQTQKALQTFTAHRQPIVSVDVSPDEKYLLTTAADNTLRIWDLSTYQEVLQIQLSGSEDWLVKSPEGYYAASRGFAENITFSQQQKTYTFEQFDLKLNRPDLVFGKTNRFSNT
ncbi:MAG: WD40 repeat domain-containing protein, partial [Bacteroidota bacterium]